MSLGTKLVQAVNKEAAMRRPLPLSAEATESVKNGVVHATVVLADNGRFAHLAESVTIRAERAGPPAKARALTAQQRAERLAERTTYLVESLQFVECDAGGAATLRSTPQTMRAPRAEYYEAKVSDDAVTLRRFRPRDDRPGRDAVPFAVTDDVLTRLADDAASTLVPNRKS